MSDETYESTVDPEQRMVEHDQHLDDAIADAFDDEHVSDYDGSESVENDDVSDMMAHLGGQAGASEKSERATTDQGEGTKRGED